MGGRGKMVGHYTEVNKVTAQSKAKAISDYLLTGMNHTTPEGQAAIAAIIEEEPRVYGLSTSNRPPICFSRDLAAGLAIRVEDAFAISNILLDGAEKMAEPSDWRKKTTMLIARERIGHLAHVAECLKGKE